ncbi:zinc finger MYM-type protein 1-like [Sipha flava]|uniref:Zinc finger MYM-type protein 1-like n=1 Tax=Sipha flava TaxID=143950 RepID=A0A8B8GC10_9HEMI|nr:zinc finger MYM-type protein 1-like [Sipha flava]
MGLPNQSVVDINEESEKSELNVIPNPLTQNNTNNFKDPADWTNSNICRNYIAKFGYDQNIDADFTSSKRTYSDYDRYCSRIDTQLATQVTDEINYWKAVLHRVVEVIKFLGAKGLSFRGDNEQFNKINNGNFLGTGKGTPSYLSSTIYEELLLLMKNDIIKIILKELKAAKYYSLIVDSTPDIANVDQLVIALRYVLPSGVPAERFLIFIPNSGHKSKEMSNVVMDFLNSHNIPIENCRGQSYDNARNMSGQYSGLQSRIKSFNSFAEYVPCSAHSLNLVGTCAAESCNSATSFFMLLQELYNFFSSSTARWDILKTYLKKNLSVKNLSVTRWSARFDSCHALFNSYAFIIEALHSIVDNQKEKAVYKVEANGLLARLKTLETGLMICIWNIKQF